MKLHKWIVAILNLAAVIIVIINADFILDWIQTEEKGSILAVFPIVVLLAAVPGIPFGVVSGILGAKFGALWGSTMSVTASTMAALLVYVLFRYLLKRQGTIFLEKHRLLRLTDQYIRNRTFWSILIARIIPIMPAALINIYAGVFGLRFKPFFLATLLGKIPVIAAFTIFGDSLISGNEKWISVLLLYVLFLLIVYGAFRLVSNQRR